MDCKYAESNSSLSRNHIRFLSKYSTWLKKHIFEPITKKEIQIKNNMSLINYSKNQFTEDFNRVNIKRLYGNNVYDINEVASQINNLSENDKAYYYFCLFISSCADQNMHAHFKNNYEYFKKISQYPKLQPNSFSVVGKPESILDAAIELNIDFGIITIAELEEFMDAQFALAPIFLGNNISVKEFFEAMMKDKDFHHNSPFFNRFLGVLKNKVNNLENK